MLWGTHVNVQIGTNIAQFYSDAAISNWYDMLSEYASVGGTNQSIGRGTSVSAITINPSLCALSSSCTVTDAQLQTEIINQIQSGALPQPQQDSAGHTNTAYMVHFPPNVHLKAPDGSASCANGGFCGYHNTATFGSGNIALPYGAMMDTVSNTSACSTGCGGNANALDNETSLLAHELAEVVTDADVGLDTQAGYAYPAAWGDNTNNCGEIADICDSGAPGSTITVSGRSWIVQQLWSNARNACLGTALNPNYVVSAPTAISAGTAFTFTVTAKNPSGNKGTDIAYVGTVHFTSSDPGATFPADFTYVPEDQGTYRFTATLNSAGSQTITATDTLNGSIVGTSSSINVSAVAASPSQCSGANTYVVSFLDNFPGTSLDPTHWSATVNGGTIAVAGNSVALAAPNGSAFPYVTSIGSPIPGSGNFSVRWIAAYNSSQAAAGTGALALAQTLPSNGAASWLDVADAWQDSNYRVQVQNPAGSLTTAYSTASNVAQHDVEYCWLASTTEVYVDGVRKLQQARDPGVLRPTALWFGNPSNTANTWVPFTLSRVEVRALMDNTTTSVTSSANPSVVGQLVMLTATVTAASPSAGTPTGTVTFLDGAASIGTATLSGSGTASLATAALTVGSHTISASYGGDGNFNGSAGALSTNPQVVQTGTTTSLSTTCPTTFVESQSIALTATVSGSNPGGSVAFQDGTTVFCGSAALSSGVANCQTPSLMVQGTGTSFVYHLIANYTGDGTYSASASSPVALTVLKAGDVIFRYGFEANLAGCPAR
ncbi:Ig-like domain-containing protein [Dokdonella soli]|uniref:Ig-like domain-containing protein n=1 Tax=Dokdonella soli TaxID=529810 RepID=UPI0031E33D6A